MSLPTKAELLFKYLPRKKGTKMLLPTQQSDLTTALIEHYPEHKFTVTKVGGSPPGKTSYDAALIQYTGTNAKEAMSYLSDMLLRLKPGAIIAIEGVIKSNRFMRSGNKAISTAVNAMQLLQTIKEIVQLDVDSGDGIFVGRTST